VSYDVFADKGTGYFLIEIAKYVFFDLVGDLANLLRGDGPFVAGLLKADNNFFPVIRNAGVVLFYHVHLETVAGLFVRGEPLFARQALASSSDYPTAVAGPRIDYLIPVFLAERTPHGSGPPRFQTVRTLVPKQLKVPDAVIQQPFDFKSARPEMSKEICQGDGLGGANRVCCQPEPATLLLLGIGGFLIRKRN
jgi:hypothetical protein